MTRTCRAISSASANSGVAASRPLPALPPRRGSPRRVASVVRSPLGLRAGHERNADNGRRADCYPTPLTARKSRLLPRGTQTSPRNYPGSCSQREPNRPKGDDARSANLRCVVCGSLAPGVDLKRAHNPKVAGSNPAPATMHDEGLADADAANPFRLPGLREDDCARCRDRLTACPRYQSSFEASRAPSARLASFAQTMSGSTAAWPTQVPKPQSVPAMTFSRPTSRA